MSNQQKLVIVVLVLVAALFAVAVIYGLFGQEESGGYPDERPDFTEVIKDLLVGDQRLKMRETSVRPGNCRPPDARSHWIVRRDRTCEVTIEESDATLRVAGLELTQGQEVAIVLTQPQSVRETRRLTLEEPCLTLDIFGDESQLALTCTLGPATGCRVDLTECPESEEEE